jgi:3'-5' exoribonuclease
VPDTQHLYDFVVQMLTQKCTIPERQIALNLYSEYKDQLVNWAAATSNHHALKGGLIYHTFRMVKAAYLLKNVYYMDRETNEESMKSWNLLMIGCALHDIGKLKELDTNNLGNASYTKEGNFFGHLFIGATMILDEAKKGDYDQGTVERLVHMIVSHHGKQEYGAIKQPATKEAIMLNMIDDMDARVEACEEAMETTEPGSFSTTINMLDRTRIYREDD